MRLEYRTFIPPRVAAFAALTLIGALALSTAALSQSSGSTRRSQGAQTPPTHGGDPDRPVIVGRLPNPASTEPVEVLRQTVEGGRLTLIDPRGGRHPIPDGIYEGLRTDATIVLQGKEVSVKASKDVVLKGSKIGENTPPAPGGANRLALGDTAGTELLAGLPDDTYRSPLGRSLTLRGGSIVRLQGF